MTRTRLAAAAVLTLSLLAPVAAASSASAAPQACPNNVLVKDHKINKGKALKKGLNKPTFVHAGRVTEVSSDSVTFVVRGGQNKAIRGCELTVLVDANTKIRLNGDVVALSALDEGDHVNVKGTSDRTGATAVYTAKRIAASAKKDHPQHGNS